MSYCHEGRAVRATRRGRLGVSRESGLTFIELMTVVALMAILALAISPLVHHRLRRHKEVELKRTLEMMRASIDRYHEYATLGLIEPWDLDWQMFPEDLEMLVEGVEVKFAPDQEPVVLRFLREIPMDPMTGEREWSCRGYEDEPDERSSGCDNLYDVFSTSGEIAIDGSYYGDW